MAPSRHPQRQAIWIRLSLIWRWPLALVLSAVALGEAGKQLLSKPVPVAISGAIPLTIEATSRLPVSIQAERPGGLQTQLTSPVGGLEVAPVKVRSPIQAAVTSATELPVKAAVALETPVELAVSDKPLRVEVQPSGQPMQVDVQRMDMDLLP
jgi:hypothetical protein